jgi:hypothetical protein
MDTVQQETSSELAIRLTKASRKLHWDVYSYFDWPATLEGDHWYMSPELVSIYGTELWESLTENQQKRLSLYETGNFFSLTLQGERPLVQGLAHRLYSTTQPPSVTDFLHHFIDEENKHMIMFGEFCQRYLGKVYPEKKINLPRKYAKGEEEVAFYTKVMVVEELGDYYNVKMQHDDRLHPLVRKLHWVHHRDEARHLAFGRRHLAELVQRWAPGWSAETVASFHAWLARYLEASWRDFYNPAMYRDAGLPDAFEVRQMALAHPACRAHRQRVAQKLIDYFLKIGLLEQEPML